MSEYQRAARYHERSIRRTAVSLKILLTKPATSDIVAEVRFYLSELNNEYERFKKICEQALENVDATITKDELKAFEDTIVADSDAVQKFVGPWISKATLFISDFEADKVRESLNQSSFLSPAGISNETNVKLPRINVPTFIGETEDFLEYCSLF